MTVSNMDAEHHGAATARPKPNGNNNPAGEAGWFLERERVKRGYSLVEVSAATGIHAHHLSAIETGDLTGLPSRTYTLEMVGAYAEFLDFDPQPLILHYAQFLPKEESAASGRDQPAASHPRPLGSAAIIPFQTMRKFRELSSGTGGIVASLAGAVTIFAVIAWNLLPGETPGTPLKSDIAATISGDPTTVASVSRVSESELDAPAAPVENGGELTGLGALIEREIGNTGAPADADPAGQVELTPQGRMFGVENADARLVITASENVWFRIEDTNGNVVVTKTLRKGDSYKVPARPGLIVIARNGGALQYTIDGKPQGTLGLPGEILVGNPIDIETLMGKNG